MEKHKQFVADLETNFAKDKSSLSQDFDVKMQAQNESHDQKLNELVLIKEKEKEAQETNFTTIKSTMIEDFNKKL